MTQSHKSSGIRLHRAVLNVNSFIWAEGRHEGPLVVGRTTIPLALYEPSLRNSPFTRAMLELDFRSEDEVEYLRHRVAELEAES